MYLEKVKERSVGTFKMIIFYTLMSQALIFLRAKLMAENIVGHYDVEGYFIAILAATYLAEIISEGLLVSLVPVFHRIKKEEGDEGRFRFVNNLANIMMIISIAMIIIGLIFAPFIVGLFNKGLVGRELDKTIKLFRMALPMMFFILVRPVYLAYLQSNHGFKAGAKGGMYMNFVYFLYLLLFSKLGIKGLIIAGILAHGSYFLVIPSIVKSQGYEYERVLDFKDVNLPRLISAFLPMVVYILIMRANAKVDVLFTSNIGNVYGALGNANYMVGFIITVIIQVIITICYPLLSECYTEGDEESYKVILNTGLKYISTILIPVMIVVIIFAKPITNLFFGNGQVLFFKKAVLEGRELRTTILSFRYLGLSIIFIGMNLFLIRALFSRHDFLGPIIISILGIFTNYLFGRLFVDQMGEVSVALSKTISNIVMGILLLYRVNGKKSLVDMKGLRINTIKTLVLSTVVVLLIYICYKLIGQNDTSLVIGLVLSFYAYFNLYGKVGNKKFKKE